MKKVRKRLAYTVLTALAGLLSSSSLPSASAAPNGYTQIPIAKVFGDGVASFSLARSELSTKTTVYTTQYGFLNRFEAGIDYLAAPEPQRTFLGNVKALFAHNPGHIPDIAVGMQNVATGQKASPYMVATTSPGNIGVSLGATRPGGAAYYGMGGIAYTLNPVIQIVADDILGRGNYATAGVIASVTPELTLNVAYARANETASGLPENGYVVNLAYTFHLKHGKSQPSPGNKNPTGGGTGQAGGGSK